MKKTCFCEERASDFGPGVNDILQECSMDDASWRVDDLPNSITLRRMIALCDWVSSEPLRWRAYRIRYIDGITSSTQIAQKLHVSDRTVRRLLSPAYLRIKLKQKKEKENGRPI